MLTPASAVLQRCRYCGKPHDDQRVRGRPLDLCPDKACRRAYYVERRARIREARAVRRADEKRRRSAKDPINILLRDWTQPHKRRIRDPFTRAVLDPSRPRL